MKRLKAAAIALSIAALWMIAALPAQAEQVRIMLYEVKDSTLAEQIEAVDDAYDEREEPLKDERRGISYGSPEYEAATRAIEDVKYERNRKFLELLSGTTPTVDWRGSGQAGETIEATEQIDGKPFGVRAELQQPEGDSIPVALNATHDGRKLYEGTALLLRVGAPHLLNKVFVKIDGQRQGQLLFVQVDE